MKAILAVLAGLAAAVATLPAQAQQPAGITLEQFQASRRAMLMRADTDHDGRISAAEWAAAHPNAKDPARQFARLDADHDGFLTASEIDRMLAMRFARLDTNHDGVLSAEELAAVRAGRPEPGQL